MKIWKALNNNVAVVLDEKGQEKIVMGKGICFKKGAGDSISDDSIDKTFSLSGADGAHCARRGDHSGGQNAFGQ